MHILFLSDNFPPEVNAPASRTFEHCREWVKVGHTVTVITCAPNFPKGQVFPGYRNWLWQREKMEGIQVIRVWSYIAKNEGFALRIIDYLSYMLSAFIAAIFVRRVDVIVGTSPQFFTACAAYGVSVFKRRPWIFELRDIWPESIQAVGAMKAGRIFVFLEQLEMFLYRKANAVVAVTKAFKQNLIARGIDPTKIFVVTNGVDCSRFVPKPKDQDLISELQLKDKFVLGYIGTLGLAHSLGTILEAAKLLSARCELDDIKIIMLGDGAYKRFLEDRVVSENIKNIIFIDTVSKGEVARYWSICDASIIHLKKSKAFEKVIPSKLFECMGMAIPVLHGVEGESAEIVAEYEIGLTFEPDNHVELVEQLLVLRDDLDLRQRLSRNSLKAATQYDRKYLAERMLKIIQGCIA